MIRTLIVDDERRARAYLAKLVAAHEDVEIVGQARDGLSALGLIDELSPDLVFLDVQMPEMNGLDVARRLEKRPAPVLVFTTAYDRFALEAFELSATDYLLKPYDSERLARALQRARAFLRGSQEGGQEVADRLARLLDALEGRASQPAPAAAEPAEVSLAQLSRLPVQAKGRIVLLDLDEVYQIASDDRLVFAHTKDERFLVNFSIKELERRLPADRFFRNHRSGIVNLAHVREIVPWFHGKLMLKLDNGGEATVSEDRAPGLRATVGLTAADERR
jgi:DNA-binding LytR/AlgR family response regulator